MIAGGADRRFRIVVRFDTPGVDHVRSVLALVDLPERPSVAPRFRAPPGMLARSP